MKKKLLAIFAALGFTARVQNKETLTQTEWDQVKAAYKEKYGTELLDDMNNPDQEEEAPATSAAMTEEQIASIYALLGEPENSEHNPQTLRAESGIW